MSDAAIIRSIPVPRSSEGSPIGVLPVLRLREKSELARLMSGKMAGVPLASPRNALACFRAELRLSSAVRTVSVVALVRR
jgi:hypothetical protein